MLLCRKGWWWCCADIWRSDIVGLRTKKKQIFFFWCHTMRTGDRQTYIQLRHKEQKEQKEQENKKHKRKTTTQKRPWTIMDRTIKSPRSYNMLQWIHMFECRLIDEKDPMKWQWERPTSANNCENCFPLFSRECLWFASFCNSLWWSGSLALWHINIPIDPMTQPNHCFITLFRKFKRWFVKSFNMQLQQLAREFKWWFLL